LASRTRRTISRPVVCWLRGLEVNAVKGHFGDLGVADPLPEPLIEHRPW
jgi:hypothetical protein